MPIYNSEKYLAKALDSIINQSYKNFELICVDDGSVDSSKEILYNYSLKDNRIITYRHPNNENKGISASRQLGTDKAKGEYFIHFDSDDWAEPKHLENMINFIVFTNSDIIYTDYTKEYSDNNKDNSIVNCCLNKQDLIKCLITEEWFPCLWNKMIKTSFVKNNDIKFIKNINLAEDALFLLQILIKKCKIKYLPVSTYHYNLRNDSITHTIDKEYVKSELNAIKVIKNIVNNEKYNSYIKERLLQKKFALLRLGKNNINSLYKVFPKLKFKDLLSSNKISCRTKIELLLADLGFINTSKELTQTNFRNIFQR